MSGIRREGTAVTCAILYTLVLHRAAFIALVIGKTLIINRGDLLLALSAHRVVEAR